MDYPIELPGHTGLNLALRAGSLFTGAKILKDGVPLKKNKGAVSVPLADGSMIELKIKIGFDLCTPKIVYAGQEIEVMPPLPVYWMIWAYFPLVLIFIGGALGGLCGGMAAGGTLAVLRSDLPKPARLAIALLAPPLAFVVYGAVIFMILRLRKAQ